MTITDLLDSLNGKSEEIPKVIQQLCGKTFIFRFMLKEQNLTEGKEYYLVKKTFEPDEKLELQYSNHQAENDHNIEDTHDKKISDLFDAEELKHSKYKNGNFELKHTSDPILEAKLFCVM